MNGRSLELFGGACYPFTALNCPKYCLDCTGDVTKCLKCNPGYTLTTDGTKCALDYDKQFEWGGSCGIGKKQTPINIVSTDAQKCTTWSQFYQKVVSTTVNIQPTGIDLTA